MTAGQVVGTVLLIALGVLVLGFLILSYARDIAGNRTRKRLSNELANRYERFTLEVRARRAAEGPREPTRCDPDEVVAELREWEPYRSEINAKY